jgi:eukaryotic-like serine/threonine-protein kinase
MARTPPRHAAPHMGGPASSGETPSSSAGPRAKENDKQPGTFFLGRYRVVDEIGVGGMASVHLARMDGPGGFQKWVAIKRIHPHLVEDDQFVDMFLDEARIAAGINHANVAQVFDLGKDDNTYWIAMEYLHGEPLREVMRRADERGVRITPELAARICSDAAEGLHAAHELRGKNGQLLGLVHRDVTPHNLFLTYDGYTKVVDFGIAKVADRLSSTRAGTLKGKLAYMSPEQVRGAEVDRTTDVFALGVVLWELTTNQRLFRMDTDLDTLEKVQACNVPAPSTLIANYPLELEGVVMKALAKRKQDRFQSAREFSRALQNFLMRQGAFVGPEEVAAFVRQVFADRIQKREAHLAWAAEVTSTINVDALRAAGMGGMPSLTDDDSNKRSRGPQPAGGSPPLASMSLMDDDEDVPTTVALREQLEMGSRAPAPSPGLHPRPAAGAPAAGPPPPGFPQNGAQQQRPPFGQQPGGYGPPQQPFGGAPQHGYPQQQMRPFGPGPGERAPNAPGALPDDLGSTVALPSHHHGEQDQRPRQPFAPFNPPGGGAQGYGPPPTSSFNGQGYGPPPPPYGYGPPPTSMQGTPSPGQQQHSPLRTPLPSMPSHPNAPQSQIETALSLPRPDPAEIWRAQQEKDRGDRRNTTVLIAVVALTALCVIGIGALVYLKLRASAAPPAPIATEVAAVAAPPTAAPLATSAAESPTASAAAPSADPAAPAPLAAPAPVNAGAPAGAITRSAVASPAANPASGASGPPGFLTLVCNPGCDDVQDGGRSLGPAPVVRASLKPGQHRLTLIRGSTKRILSVMIESGQTTAQTYTMK